MRAGARGVQTGRQCLKGPAVNSLPHPCRLYVGLSKGGPHFCYSAYAGYPLRGMAGGLIDPQAALPDTWLVVAWEC
jgi:hypothetical protein